MNLVDRVRVLRAAHFLKQSTDLCLIRQLKKYVFWQNWTSLARISRKVAPYFSSKQKNYAKNKSENRNQSRKYLKVYLATQLTDLTFKHSVAEDN